MEDAMTFKTSVGVVLIQGRDDDLVEEMRSAKAKSDRMRDLAFKGLKWEEAVKNERDGAK